MIFGAAMKNFSTIMRGDPVTFQLSCLVGGGDAMLNYVPPEGATFKAAVQRTGNSRTLVLADSVAVVNQYGYLEISFSKEKTLIMPLGQPELVVTVEKDDFRHTFNTKLPFMLIDPPFNIT